MQLQPSHITKAIARSSDEGKTLLFAKLGLTTIPVNILVELELVERLAFPQNALHTLPTDFCRLAHLRYLNLRGNNLVALPECIALLPSLDTLDVSNNKISKFPSEPKKLINLKTLILNRNLLPFLPSYISKFERLRTLHLDRNPLEWPPKAVINVPSKKDSDEGMADWVRSLQLWMEADVAQNGAYSQRADDSGYSSVDAGKELQNSLEDSFNSWSRFGSSSLSRRSSHYRGSSTSSGASQVFPRLSTAAADYAYDGRPITSIRSMHNGPHSRTFSIDSSFSIDSIAESELEDADFDMDVSITTNDSGSLDLDYVSKPSKVKRRAGLHRHGPSYASSISQEPAEIHKEEVPSLHLGILQPFGPENSPTRLFFDRDGRDSYLPSPAHSEDTKFFEADTASSFARRDNHSSILTDSSTSTLKDTHQRNLSLVNSTDLSSFGHRGDHSSVYGSNPLAKKSLPDLRTAKLSFSKKNTQADDSVPLFAPGSSISNRRRQRREPQQPQAPLVDDGPTVCSPVSLRQDSGSSQSTSACGSSRSFGGGIRPLFAGTGISPTRTPSLGPNTPPQNLNTNPPPALAASGLHQAPSLASERNSYFRRLSHLPSHKKTLPPPLLTLIDSARSILFALSQVYQGLEAFVLNDAASTPSHDSLAFPDASDRVALVLRKVLQPASLDLKSLITSLSQFDDVWAKRTVPSPLTCRAIVETCKEAAGTFGKVLDVLFLQLPLLFTSGEDSAHAHSAEDARFQRALLLMLYGAMAEIAGAWHRVGSVADDLKSFLHNSKDLKTSAPYQGESPSMTGSRPSTRNPPNTPRPTLTHGSRRNAGSFSIRDLEIGKTMPEVEEVSPVSALSPSFNGSARAMPRAQKRKASLASTTSNPSGTLSGIPGTLSDRGKPSELDSFREDLEGLHPFSHSRQGSQASFLTSSSASSPSLPNHYPAYISDAPSVGATGKSSSTVDTSAIYSIREVLEVAAAVWDGLEDVLTSSSDPPEDQQVRESLSTGRAITKRLADVVSSTVAESRLLGLGEDAKLLLKTIIHLSTVYKTKFASYTPDEALRVRLAQLNTAATELAIFLRVASFTSSTRPHPQPPLLSPGAGSPGIITTIAPPTPSTAATLLAPRSAEERTSPEPLPWKSGLSRSRSAQPHASAKFAGMPFDEPRSALPSQTFQIPVNPTDQSQRRQREVNLDFSDAG